MYIIVEKHALKIYFWVMCGTKSAHLSQWLRVPLGEGVLVVRELRHAWPGLLVWGPQRAKDLKELVDLLWAENDSDLAQSM